MPLRVSNAVEKNVISVGLSPITVAAATSTLILPSIIGDTIEYAARYVFNAGDTSNSDAKAYYAYGHNVDLTNYEGWIVPGQQFNASDCGMALYVYSVAGTTISRTVLKRNDNEQGTGGIL